MKKIANKVSIFVGGPGPRFGGPGGPGGPFGPHGGPHGGGPGGPHDLGIDLSGEVWVETPTEDGKTSAYRLFI